jgi:hypothetical protein
MEDAMFVGGGKTGAQLAGDVVSLLRGRRPMRSRTETRVSPSTYSIDR